MRQIGWLIVVVLASAFSGCASPPAPTDVAVSDLRADAEPRPPRLVTAYALVDGPSLQYDLRVPMLGAPLDGDTMSATVADAQAVTDHPAGTFAWEVVGTQGPRPEALAPGSLVRVTLAHATVPTPCERVTTTFVFAEGVEVTTELQMPASSSESHSVTQLLEPSSSCPLQARAQSTGKEASEAVNSPLKIVGVYGTRNDTESDLRAILVNVELPAGAPALALTHLIIRYTDNAQVRHYEWSDETVRQDGAADLPHFSAEWLRGDGANGVMEAGDLVQLTFLLAEDLGVRQEAEMNLIPETGAATMATFRTPPTFGSDMVITLR